MYKNKIRTLFEGTKPLGPTNNWPNANNIEPQRELWAHRKQPRPARGTFYQTMLGIPHELLDLTELRGGDGLAIAIALLVNIN